MEFCHAHFSAVPTCIATCARQGMNADDTPSYLLSNYLGSTSLTTDDSGSVTPEQRYTASGEVRYNSGNTAVKYTYTGQYSYTFANLGSFRNKNVR